MISSEDYWGITLVNPSVLLKSTTWSDFSIEVALKFKSMIDVQWALVCAAAMSGTAQAPELLRGGDDDDDDNGYAVEERLREWIEYINRG